ncbi:PucR family transcriptional regulator, partial [Streptomyces asiaticus]
SIVGSTPLQEIKKPKYGANTTELSKYSLCAAEDFGFLGLLLAGTREGAPDGTGVQDFVARTVGAVIDYDERRGTELIRTLDAYFAGGMSPARTKDALHVHVNTVAQRLERVGRLLGPDWQSPARSLEIQLALRLHRLTSAMGY